MRPSIDIHAIPDLLAADVAHTLGAEYLPALDSIVAATRELVCEPSPHPTDSENVGLHREQFPSSSVAQDWFDWKVVEDFQQWVHDQHLDTSWPACPRHHRHPLDYSHERHAWTCFRDIPVVIRLGALAAR